MSAVITAIKPLLSRLSLPLTRVFSRSYLPLLMPLVLYFGAQGIYYWQAQQGFLALIEELNPGGRIEVEGFAPAFDGRLRIDSLRLYSESGQELLDVRALVFDGGDWQSLLSLLSAQDALPEQLKLSAGRLYLSPARLADFGGGLALLQCATEKTGWQGGEHGLVVDLQGRYQFDAESGYARLEATLASEQLSELSLAFVLAVNKEQPGWLDIIDPDNGWAGGRLEFSPVAPLFAQRCAANAGIALQEYLNIHVKGVERFAAHQGWALGPRLASALQRFYTGARGLSIVIDPQQIEPLRRLAAQDAETLFAAHSTQLYSGDRDLGPLDLAWRRPKADSRLPKDIASLETAVREAKEQPMTPQEYVALAATATPAVREENAASVVAAELAQAPVKVALKEPEPSTQRSSQQKVAAELSAAPVSVGNGAEKAPESGDPLLVSSPYVAENPPAVPVSRYQRTPVGRLIRHVGEPVRLITTNGRTIEGELRRVRGDVAEVIQQIGTGQAQLPVRISRIDRFYSYH